MKLWLITQQEATGYDTYDKAVVLAETQEAAKLIHPSDYYDWKGREWGFIGKSGIVYDDSWAKNPEQVSATYLGEADSSITDQIICTSFNAG